MRPSQGEPGVKSGSRLVIILVIIFVPVLAIALSSIASHLPRTEELSPSLHGRLDGCPAPLICVTNVSGQRILTAQIIRSSAEFICFRTASATPMPGQPRYVDCSGGPVHSGAD